LAIILFVGKRAVELGLTTLTKIQKVLFLRRFAASPTPLPPLARALGLTESANMLLEFKEKFPNYELPENLLISPEQNYSRLTEGNCYTIAVVSIVLTFGNDVRVRL